MRLVSMAGTRGGIENMKSATVALSIARKDRHCLPIESVSTHSLAAPEQSIEFSRREIRPEPAPISEFGFKNLSLQEETDETCDDVNLEEGVGKTELKKNSKKVCVLRLKLGNASLKRLLSGAFAGAVSRTAVAPLETIRTHLMVGSGGKTVGTVFRNIIDTEGWQGLFRGNGINVLRVAPSKAIELFVYDTVKKHLTPKAEERSRIPFPISTIAGATAGVCSTLCTYPLELLKTRVTIERGVYKGLMHALVKIWEEEGFMELYRGLSPSLVGVVPYAATNYFAYETLRKAYKHLTKEEQIGNLATLLIGSASGAIASATTFPLEVARKRMQVGALNGRQVYNNVFHALTSIIEKEGPAGLYIGLGASCMKLMPAAGISFMCYEACKAVFIEEESQ